MKSFFERLLERQRKIDSLLCVGLDPHEADLSSLSATSLEEFCWRIVTATRDVALAYKPNSAFFEQVGPEGMAALKNVIASLPEDIPVILDVKRGDISSTAEAYAAAAFDVYRADAVTINPYLGRDAVLPFSSREEKGIFLLCKTSNPGSSDLQDLLLADSGPGLTVYEHLARTAREWNEHENIGLVVGATHPRALGKVRKAAPELWFLAPGIGAQGGDVREALQAGIRADGTGMIIPVSRGISRAADPHQAALKLRDTINRSLSAFTSYPPRQSSDGPLSSLQQKIADDLLKSGCLKFGEYTLKSGAVSPFYIDLRRLAAYPELLRKTARAFYSVLKGLDFDHLAPLPYAALPIGTAVSLLGGWSMVYPRKEAKSYGTRAVVEGVFQPGDKAVVLDDLITTGGSKLEGVQKLAENGLGVQDVVVLIDRSAGAGEELAQRGLRLHAVLRIQDLLEYYSRTDQVGKVCLNAAREFLTSGD